MATLDMQERVHAAQTRVVDQLEQAQKQLVQFEKEMVAFGRTQRRELGRLVARVKSGRELKAFTRKAQKATRGLKSHLDALPASVLDAVGAASSSQVEDLSRKVARLSKQVERLQRGTRAQA